MMTVLPKLSRFTTPFLKFFHQEASGGIVLLVCTALALALANSPLAGLYEEVWHRTFTIGFDTVRLTKSLHHWINDGLMAIFFLTLGLELKREFLVGELSSIRKSILPIAGAVGGAALPAAIYLMFNMPPSGTTSGWGIPMATDIAFALGLLALFGNRVPLGLKVFLTALVVMDDLLAVLVITFFYTSEISWPHVLLAGSIFGLMLLLGRMGLRGIIIPVFLGVSLWLALLFSGIHATIAGVLIALTVPIQARTNTRTFYDHCREALEDFRQAGLSEQDELLQTSTEHQSALYAIHMLCRDIESAEQRIIRSLHSWVVFVILPVFAFANAGISLGGEAITLYLNNSIALGVMAGLVFGKPLGILITTRLIVSLGIATLPTGVTWRQIIGVSCLAGIGFTMSIFITMLAFGEETAINSAKMGTLAGSVASALIGLAILRFAFNNNHTLTEESPA